MRAPRPYRLPVSIFNQFTFFSVLIPGLFSVALLLPLGPIGIVDAGIGQIILLVLAFSFIFGMGAHAGSEILELFCPIVIPPTSRLTHKLNAIEDYDDENKLLFSDLGSYEETTVREFANRASLHLAGEPTYNRKDITPVYQSVLNSVWRTDSGLVRMLFSTYMLCRAMLVISLLIFIIYLVHFQFAIIPKNCFKGVEQSSSESCPLFTLFISPDSTGWFYFLVLVGMALSTLVFWFGYHRFTEFTVNYLMIEFNQNEKRENIINHE